MLGLASPQRGCGRGGRHLSEHREFEDGEIIPGTRYRVQRLIGVGGMGSVYEVEHVELGKRFVLKALLRELTRREDLAQRLRNEWRALARLQHENIVNVTDAGTSSSGVPYYVMERLDGDTLATVLRQRRRLHVLEAVAVAAAVLEALSAAHDIGVIHRDVKPANIFMVKGGGVKLLDFGIAKIADANSVVTARGLAVGTPRYMSPEQARGERVDGRSDVYATGLILFEMIAGVGPFDDARDANELLLAHLAREAPPLSSLVMGVSPELEAILDRMLAKDFRARPAHAREVAAQLRAFALRHRSAPATDVPTAPANYSPDTLGAARRVTPNPLHSLTTRPESPARPPLRARGANLTPSNFTPSDGARTQRMEPTALTEPSTLTVHSAPSFEPSSVPDTTFVSSPAFEGSTSTTLELSHLGAHSGLERGFPPPSSGGFVERPERTEMLGETTPAPPFEAGPTRTKVPLAERPVSVTPPPVVDMARSHLPAAPPRQGKLVAGALLGLLLVGGLAVHFASGSAVPLAPTPLPLPAAAASASPLSAHNEPAPADPAPTIPAPAAPEPASVPVVPAPAPSTAGSTVAPPAVSVSNVAPMLRGKSSLVSRLPEASPAAPLSATMRSLPAQRPKSRINPAKRHPETALPSSGL